MGRTGGIIYSIRSTQGSKTSIERQRVQLEAEQASLRMRQDPLFDNRARERRIQLPSKSTKPAHSYPPTPETRPREDSVKSSASNPVTVKEITAAQKKLSIAAPLIPLSRTKRSWR